MKLTPIYVYFNLNERDALQAAAIMREKAWQPRIHDRQGPGLDRTCKTRQVFPMKADWISWTSGISTSTGTIQLRAIFDNEDQLLLPACLRACGFRWGNPSRCRSCRQRHRQRSGGRLRAGGGGGGRRRAARRGKGPHDTDGCAIRSGLTAQDRVIVNGTMRAAGGQRHAGDRAAAPSCSSQNQP